MENVDRPRDYVRPPVPSDEESARASWMAFVAILGSALLIRPRLGPESMLVYGILVCVIMLFGLAAGVWAFYVAAGWGPRKHLLPATVGITLNSLLIAVTVSSFYYAIQARQNAQRNQPQLPTQATENTDSNLVGDRYTTQLTR